MPSASSYINKLRVNTEARNVKVQYPGSVGNLTQPLLSITCNIPSSRWNSIQYVELCRNACKPSPSFVCADGIETIYNADSVGGVSAPCVVLDGLGINISGTTILNGGVEC
jgi:hypothetical protein